MSAFRLACLSLLFGTVVSSSANGADFAGNTVVNNAFVVPGDPLGRKFNSYNRHSSNEGGLVAFRARSEGGMGGEPAHGVYARDMASAGPIMPILDRNTLVPMPNNLGTT